MAPKFIARVADAGQVRDGSEVGLADDADDQVVRPLARRAAGAVGDRDERRLQCLQAGDVGNSSADASSVLGGKNSKLNVVGCWRKMSWMCMGGSADGPIAQVTEWAASAEGCGKNRTFHLQG